MNRQNGHDCVERWKIDVACRILEAQRRRRATSLSRAMLASRQAGRLWLWSHELTCNIVEDTGQVRAHEPDRRDDGDRDQCGDETVFDRGHAFFRLGRKPGSDFFGSGTHDTLLIEVQCKYVRQ